MNTKRDEVVTTFEGTPTTRDEWRASEPRLPLFSTTTESDTVGEPLVETYTYPAKPNPGLALEFLRQGRRLGGELAVSWLIEEAIGSDGYDALVRELEGYTGDGAAVLRGMGEKLQKSIMGGLEGPKA